MSPSPWEGIQATSSNPERLIGAEQIIEMREAEPACGQHLQHHHVRVPDPQGSAEQPAADFPLQETSRNPGPELKSGKRLCSDSTKPASETVPGGSVSLRPFL